MLIILITEKLSVHKGIIFHMVLDELDMSPQGSIKSFKI